MGWTSSRDWRTLKGIIANRIEGWTQTDPKVLENQGCDKIEATCLNHCVRGAVTHSCRLWTVWEHRKYLNGALIATDRFIGIDLLEFDRREKCWGYKDMCETMGVYEVDCPLSYLDLVPCPAGEYAAPWREKVRAFHAAHSAQKDLAKKVKLNDILKLREGTRPQIVKVVQLRKMKRGHQIIGSAGGLYRIRPKDIERIMTPEEYAAIAAT